MEKKLILRRAYGFRNVENCRLRVRVLCGEAGENRAEGMPLKAHLGKTFEIRAGSKDSSCNPLSRCFVMQF